MNPNIDKVIIRPQGSLQILSSQEASQLSDMSAGGLNDLLRQCALAVLNTGSPNDSGLALLEAYPDFDIQVNVKGRGVQLILKHPPKHAFVDGEMIVGLKEHLYAVLRDLVYARNEILESGQYDLNDSSGITNAVFHMARNARLLVPGALPNVVVCWGGHSITREEYDYSKHQGYEFGLRHLDVCTGCGPGAMKGPMKGAVLGHGKQRYRNGRYIGISEPGIIAAEAPNAIVNELCILPDIEKRLEAFVRIGHGIVVFPGGVGTMEEILYLLSILLHPNNQSMPFPLIFTGPASSQNYFDSIIRFIETTLGAEAAQRMHVIIDNPAEVARQMRESMEIVRQDRKESSDAYYYNWRLHIEFDLQQPFMPSHANMAELNLHRNQPAHQLASQLRKAFSGIVAGNVKADGIREIEFHGPFEIHGDPEIMHALDELLEQFIEQKRMKIDASTYNPCYKIIR
ncbi:nucleotide 5'-monophosphate nucleosidase PpnN [Thiomicrorhabdus sp. zzn3]|uniref:nucleotide 5'-monophosphate nucleosidase PpnN n=1 Tax=Thiomicrorhabdus sp. zzn3 TaxID=3039775 RepID=UPI00243665A1|nr:nucleotide 5'-monophosphate nucleosidase PpnN [Thiomicrorhabdus sp. zzn3]MDG6777146.1 nucleotide 5'-monophosphate nucleosidase PpnN [Thiomicrorhabdus sp. zzn3]